MREMELRQSYYIQCSVGNWVWGAELHKFSTVLQDALFHSLVHRIAG